VDEAGPAPKALCGNNGPDFHNSSIHRQELIVTAPMTIEKFPRVFGSTLAHEDTLIRCF
jgi:hypothetical protein